MPRKKRAERLAEKLAATRAPVNREALAKNNSYGAPEFVTRGYYEDTPFKCVDCGVDQVWTATQQKWWYEVAKGFAYSHAKRCRACRHAKRDAKAVTTAKMKAGLAAKTAKR